MSIESVHYENHKDRDDEFAPKRTPGQIRKDRIDISRLYVQGYTSTYIAHWISENRDYTLSPQTIRADIKNIIEEWREQYLPDIDTMKVAELARIDAVIREAWEGWYSSRKEKESTETERTLQETKAHVKGSTPVPIFEESKSKLKTENRDGDARFLEVIDKCIARRTKILGIEAPSRHEIKDWRKEAERAGFDASRMFEDMVNAAVEQDEDDREQDSDS